MIFFFFSFYLKHFSEGKKRKTEIVLQRRYNYPNNRSSFISYQENQYNPFCKSSQYTTYKKARYSEAKMSSGAVYSPKPTFPSRHDKISLSVRGPCYPHTPGCSGPRITRWETLSRRTQLGEDEGDFFAREMKGRSCPDPLFVLQKCRC